jgi:hypothetical protein
MTTSLVHGFVVFSGPARFLLSRVAYIVAILGIPAAGHAQEFSDSHSCTVNAGWAWSSVQGTDQGTFNGGAKDFSVGAGIGPRPQQGQSWRVLGTVNFFFEDLGVTRQAIDNAKILNPLNLGLLQANGGSGKAYGVSLDPQVRFGNLKHFKFYAFGGFGWFRESSGFTISGESNLLQPGSHTVYSTHSSSGSVDGGVGVNIKPWRAGAMPYLEARVIHGLAINSSLVLVPLSVGIRW